MKQRVLTLLFLISIFTISSRCQSTTCDTQNYIIPYEALDKAFDEGIDAVRSQENLVKLVENPNFENVKNYLLSLAPFSAPLFAFACISFILFIATIIQVICFNTCSKECCGNQIHSSTYNVCCLRAMVVFYILFSFLIVALSIAAMVVNSDLQKAADFTSCNTQNVIEETYNGNKNESIPWSGINNFHTDVEVFAVNIQNTMPYLISYFQSSSYDFVTSQVPDSSYANTQTFNTICVPSTEQIQCPFPDQSVCTLPYNPVFNAQFCNASFNGSAANLIQNEASSNSTVWLNNIMGMQTTLNEINTNADDVAKMVSSVKNFTNSVGDYEENLKDGFVQADNIMNNIEIAFYVFYSFLILLGIVGLTSICCVYYCLSFKCKYMMYFLWYVYALLAILFFVGAGLLLGSSIFTYDTCTAYPYYFSNQTNFNTLTFGSQQLGSIFETCFYTNSTSMFKALTTSDILNQFAELQTQYSLALPAATFSTVVSSIEVTLNNYSLNPDNVTIADVTSSEQPSLAMTQLNLFGNSSATGTSQSCKATNDFFTFDVANCYPYLTNQSPPQNDCVVLVAPNISDIINSRVNLFDSRNCDNDSTTYSSSVNAMIEYGQSIKLMINQLAPIVESNPPVAIHQYENNYFNYWVDIRNFFNAQVVEIFDSFFDPYLSLEVGSNCGFVTVSMNAIVDIACNQFFPYVNTFSAINIATSVFIFLLFILSYFLTTRFHFYEFLEGNYENFGVETKTTKDLQQAYDFDTGRQIELLPNGQRVY